MGKQKRPNIHIDDFNNIYLFFLKKKIKFVNFNAGFENLSILNIAKKIRKEIPSKIKIIKNSNDPRSYNLDATRLLKIGFRPKKKISNAINEIKEAYLSGKLKDKKNFYSVKWLKGKLKKF